MGAREMRYLPRMLPAPSLPAWRQRMQNQHPHRQTVAPARDRMHTHGTPFIVPPPPHPLTVRLCVRSCGQRPH